MANDDRDDEWRYRRGMGGGGVYEGTPSEQRGAPDQPGRGVYPGTPARPAEAWRDYGRAWSGSQPGRGDYGPLGWADVPGRPGPHVGKGPKGYQRSDDRIREEVCERLTQHPEVDASEVEVRVVSGVVILEGEIADRRMKRMAEEAVESMPGVKDVENRLRLSEGWISAGPATSAVRGRQAGSGARSAPAAARTRNDRNRGRR